MIKHVAIGVAFAALLSSCAAGDGFGVTPSSVLLVNRSQFEILEFRRHDAADFLSADNELDAPLAIGGSYLFFELGPRRVTVLRERNRGGPVLALSSAEPLVFRGGQGYELTVFDDSFRLQDGSAIAMGADVGTSTITRSSTSADAGFVDVGN